jgi:hypothetical protein
VTELSVTKDGIGTSRNIPLRAGIDVLAGRPQKVSVQVELSKYALHVVTND